MLERSIALCRPAARVLRCAGWLLVVGVGACAADSDGDSDGACACVAELAMDPVVAGEIAGLPDAVRACFSADAEVFERDAQACLPAALGTDPRNDASLAAAYVCSDVCPDAGGVVIVYEGIAEADCCDRGGVPSYDPAWGGFVACSPPEAPAGMAGTCP